MRGVEVTGFDPDDIVQGDVNCLGCITMVTFVTRGRGSIGEARRP